MERKKRSKGSVWEFCYANKIFGTYGFEIRACGQKLVKFCTLTHIWHTHTTAAKLVVRVFSRSSVNRRDLENMFGCSSKCILTQYRTFCSLCNDRHSSYRDLINTVVQCMRVCVCVRVCVHACVCISVCMLCVCLDHPQWVYNVL